jgi:hypothetical protein
MRYNSLVNNLDAIVRVSKNYDAVATNPDVGKTNIMVNAIDLGVILEFAKEAINLRLYGER